MNKICFVVLLITLSTFFAESRISFRTGFRIRIPWRTSTVRIRSNPYRTRNNHYGIIYNTQRRAIRVRTTPKSSTWTQPTVRYPPVPTVRYYPKAITPKIFYTQNSASNNALDGLSGSALGMYLGYKLSRYTRNLNNPYNGGYPQYSVVHHYHHGDKPIFQNAVVESNAITQCNDVNICTPNTTPLCIINGTIYCVTPIGQTSICNVNLTNLQCVNSIITAPCLNSTHGNCNSTDLTTQNLEIPCVSSINVFGDFSTKRLLVQNASTMGQNTLRNHKYCVTVIAAPLVEPKALKNAEYVKYLDEHPAEKQEVAAKMRDIFNSIGSFMLL